MNSFYLPIDTKSLYFNIKNDNREGHSPTVAMPIVQGSSTNPMYSSIIRIPENIGETSRENLKEAILSKSSILAKINNIFCFPKVAVNGILLYGMPLLCMYIREEIDPQKPNFGRKKLHYPSSFSYNDSETEINNKTVFAAVSNTLNHYAFIIEGFRYDFATEILDLDATVVGENRIPYSKVFINKRGVGIKFSKQFFDRSDSYDTEILALRERLGYENIYPENYYDILEQNKRIAENAVENAVKEKYKTECRRLSEQYPYSLYDLSYNYNGEKKYIVVKYTATKQHYFNLSYKKVKFINDFQGNAQLALVTDVNGSPKVTFYSNSDINSMKKTIDSVTFEAIGG